MGGFATIMTELAAKAQDTEMVRIDVSRQAPSVRACLRKSLKAHRTASSRAVQEAGADV